MLLAAGLGAGAWIGNKVLFRKYKRALSAALATTTPRVGQGYVFLSYCRRDERFAIPLARDLMKNGIRVWIDQREINLISFRKDYDTALERLIDDMKSSGFGMENSPN